MIILLVIIAALCLAVFLLGRALHNERRPRTKPIVISVDQIVREKGYGTSETVVLLRQDGKAFTRKYDGLWGQEAIERAMG